MQSQYQALHHFTLLDGEMVVDEDPATGAKRRRYLVYDLIVLQGVSTVKWPFKVPVVLPS